MVEGGEVPGMREGRGGRSKQAEKKEVTTWYPAYAYLKTDACLYTCLSILLCAVLGTHRSPEVLGQHSIHNCIRHNARHEH